MFPKSICYCVYPSCEEPMKNVQKGGLGRWQDEPKLLPKPLWRKEKASVSFFARLLMSKCCAVLTKLQKWQPLFSFPFSPLCFPVFQEFRHKVILLMNLFSSAYVFKKTVKFILCMFFCVCVCFYAVCGRATATTKHKVSSWISFPEGYIYLFNKVHGNMRVQCYGWWTLTVAV